MAIIEETERQVNQCGHCGKGIAPGKAHIVCADCVGELPPFTHQCMRCTHRWYSRQRRPTTCPVCRNPYWDRPKTRNGRPRTRAIYPE